MDKLENTKKAELMRRLKIKKYYDVNNWIQFNKAFFNGLAKKYDATNIVHSFGLKKKIDKKVIDLMPINKRDNILDVCSGTGDIAIALSSTYPEAKVVGVDVSEKMLEVAKEKAINFVNVSFRIEDALAMNFADDTFDGAIISFGLRNLSDLRKGISEMKRIVKKGGYICNIDQGKPNNLFFLGLYKAYFYNVAPIIGKLLFHRGEFNSFRYLPESNKNFPSQDELISIYRSLGLSDIKNYNFICGAVACQIMRV